MKLIRLLNRFLGFPAFYIDRLIEKFESPEFKGLTQEDYKFFRQLITRTQSRRWRKIKSFFRKHDWLENKRIKFVPRQAYVAWDSLLEAMSPTNILSEAQRARVTYLLTLIQQENHRALLEYQG